MTWSNRVLWLEGMFLRAQHFQQQDRWLEALVRDRTTALRPHAWGLIASAVNRNLLTTGQFALAGAVGVFEDGTPFSLPGVTDQPVPMELPETTRNSLVYLALPMQQEGSVEVASNGSEGRYDQRAFEAYDTHSGSPQPAEVQIGKLRLRYMLETENRAGYHCIGLARVVEVGPDRRVTLDDQWVPPALTCSAATPLLGFVQELSGMLNQRGEVLAARITAPGSRGVADVSDFLLLQSINRAQKLIAHWAGDGNVHPVDLYAALVQMAGDFATFTEVTRRPSDYPSYRHADLQRSFAPVIADLRRSLSAVIDQTAVQIPLQKRAYGIQVGPIVDRGILRSSSFVLVTQADIPTEQMRRLFPSQVKIGAVEHIRELVNVALPGIAVRPLPVAPRQLPFYAGATYFELDRNSSHWKEMQSAGGFAVHVSGDFPNLNIELWAIRG
jgi:type VI secretion system protein ImpJ